MDLGRKKFLDMCRVLTSHLLTKLVPSRRAQRVDSGGISGFTFGLCMREKMVVEFYGEQVKRGLADHVAFTQFDRWKWSSQQVKVHL